MIQAKIYNYNLFAGILNEDENGYTFQYDAGYLQADNAQAIILTLPLTDKPYIEKIIYQHKTDHTYKSITHHIINKKGYIYILYDTLSI